MLAKWYISALIVVLTLLGVGSNNAVVMPNQEIVLQFNEAGAQTTAQNQETIAAIKAQLQAIGAVNIQLQEQSNDKLTITYYSDIAIAEVKKIIQDNTSLETSKVQSNVPKNNSPKDHPGPSQSGYDFDVYEIKPLTNTGLDGKGLTTVEHKFKEDRFFKADFYALINTFYKSAPMVLEVSNTCADAAVLLNGTTCAVPDVRAGPRI